MPPPAVPIRSGWRWQATRRERTFFSMPALVPQAVHAQEALGRALRAALA